VTASRPVARVRRFSALPARNRAVLFAIAISWLVFGALSPFFPGVRRLEVGSVAPSELRAPRTLAYASEVLTRQRRDEAAAAVPDVLVFDTAVRARQLADLDRRLERIDVARHDVTLSPSAREGAINAAAEGRLSDRSAALFATASDSLWQFLAGQARATLSGVMAGSITASDVQGQRERLLASTAPDAAPDQVRALAELLAPLVAPTVVVDRGRTGALRAEAAAAQPEVVVTVQAGDVVVRAGDALDGASIERLNALGLRSRAVDLATVGTAGLFSVTLGALWGCFLLFAGTPVLEGLRRPALAAFLLAAPLLATRVALPRLLPDVAGDQMVFLVPLATGPMLAMVLLDGATALLVSLTLALGTGFLLVNLPPERGALGEVEALRLVLVVAVMAAVAALLSARAQTVTRFLRAGIGGALVAFAVLAVFWLLDPVREASGLARAAGATLGGGLLAGFAATGGFVLLRRGFGIVTRAELMELAQLNHPLLRRLQDEAPGTFQHAVLVGNLAERAADRIGADALLVRVGAYYHDVGKLTGPAFFVENIHSGANPHDGLDPLQSTRVIHQHVTAGVDLARRERLPEAVVRFIPEHHGTRLMTFFYRRAAEADPEIEPDMFRYPGPRPRSRESALVMLADACEATVRAAIDRDEERIRAIVDGIIRERIEERQFDDCAISLRDLAVVADSFTRSLSAVYHPRVQYPEPTTRELDARRVEPLPLPPSALGPSPATGSAPPPPAAASPERST
jgi:putative nucleotidyltransferase with HDIG domain